MNRLNLLASLYNELKKQKSPPKATKIMCVFIPLPRMTFEDFCKYFHQTAICRVVNTSFFSLSKTWHEGLSHSAWRKPDRAGGCPNNKETFLKNPQVHVSNITAVGKSSSKTLHVHVSDITVVGKSSFRTLHVRVSDITVVGKSSLRTLHVHVSDITVVGKSFSRTLHAHVIDCSREKFLKNPAWTCFRHQYSKDRFLSKRRQEHHFRRLVSLRFIFLDVLGFTESGGVNREPVVWVVTQSTQSVWLMKC